MPRSQNKNNIKTIQNSGYRNFELKSDHPKAENT